LTARAHGLIVNAMWNRRLFPVWFFGLLIVAIIGHSVAIGVIWLVVMAGYAVSVLIHPRIRCLHCSGTGELRGRIYPWTFRRCPSCNSGRIIRRGATVIGLPHVKAQAQQNRQARQNTSTRQRW
jgi:hypothetical protein